MHHPVGTEIEATAKWLEEHAAPGAATVLRRVARQRDQARAQLSAYRRTTANRYRLAWHSARQRAREANATAERLAQVANGMQELLGEDVRRLMALNEEHTRTNAMLRTDMARLQVLAERAGWVPDSEARRMWRWREGWWELAYRKKNSKDGYHDSGWYLWGPAESYFGEWVAQLKVPAMTEADRLITKHLAAVAEAKR
ncbi:hypothetical protein J7E87_15065 [Streptomyces sp. ISL-1]|uniref:hypothetical protein n=1 Tax=Streptomyces sp. ISL-1 TaxID=2817657 RepID=UPI001BE6F954|nr:hypothetical protein [Streptomyces sp. ISL-1]MBT2390710.1 hypothetical protein [Streptomyces sp. ISL-1]